MIKMKKLLYIFMMYIALTLILSTRSSAFEKSSLHVEGINDYDKAFLAAELINSMRTGDGLHSLIISRSLNEAAMNRASELVLLYSHCRPNSTNPTSGLTINQSAHAEIITINDGSIEKLSKEWTNSYTNLRTIKSESYASVGIGCFEFNGDYYWCILFSKDEFVDGINSSLGRVSKTNVIEILPYHLNLQPIIVGNYYNSNFSLNKSHKINLVYKNPNYSNAKFIISSEDYSLVSENECIATTENDKFTLIDEGSTDILINCGEKQLRYNVTGNKDINDSIESDDLASDLKYQTDTSIRYTTHVENYGDSLGYSDEGIMSGTQGQALRLESITIELDSKIPGGIEYRTHVEDYGWMDYVPNGYTAGTKGEAKRLEAIQINLTGEIAEQFDIFYCVHAQNYGWLNWVKNGEMAGTSGQALRLEGIIIVLVEKDKAFPKSIDKNNFKGYYNNQIIYQSHVENIGWQDNVGENQISGTSGQALRVEAMKISLNNQLYSGDIEYTTHVENIGWINQYSKNGEMTGTEGQALRVEAIKIRLTGEMAKKYDIYYSVHVQNYGWLGWAKNGEAAGTAGQALRVEAVKIVLLDKDSKVPDGMQIDNYFYE